jgi:hypothetical protein
MKRRLRARTIAALVASVALVGGAVEAAPHLSRGGGAETEAASVSTVQSGCNRYPISIVTGGTVDLNVCISDNGTGTTAYPHIDADQFPALLDPSCQIGIELWDGDNNHYGTTTTVPCRNGSYDGDPYGPVSTPLTLHAFARFTCLVACTANYLAEGQGNSPPIHLQPTVVEEPTTTDSPATQPKPLIPLPVPPGGTGNGDDASDCAHIDRLSKATAAAAMADSISAAYSKPDFRYQDQTVAVLVVCELSTGHLIWYASGGTRELQPAQQAEALSQGARWAPNPTGEHAERAVVAKGQLDAHTDAVNPVALTVTNGFCDDKKLDCRAWVAGLLGATVLPADNHTRVPKFALFSPSVVWT